VSFEQRVQQALEDNPDNNKLKLLASGYQDAWRACLAAKTPANLKALESWESRLSELLVSLDPGPSSLPDVKAVLAYLQESRKIKSAKLYKDIKAGYLRRQKDGSFKLSHVNRYAETLDALDISPRASEDMSDLAKKKQEEGLIKIREQRISIVFDREVKQGKYVLRDEIALELAGRAMALSVGLRSALQVAAPELIQAAGGDKNRADDLMREIEKHLDEALNEFSRPINFTVSITETQEHVEE
jgi:hypothetical protein